MVSASLPAPEVSAADAALMRDHVQVARAGDAIVVRPAGSVEALPWELMEEASTVLLAPVSGRPAPLVVFDLVELASVGSVLLNLLLKCHRRVEKAGGELVLCRASAAVHELVKLTALDTVWAIYDSREEALEAIGA